MSEAIQWAKLTPEERDRLVAEKVMGWDPNAPCTGRWVPLDPEPDGLYCTGCGAEIGWGTKEWADHHEQPRAKAYTQSMDLAWEVLNKMLERQEEEYYFKHFEFDGPHFKPSFHYLTAEGYPLGTTCWYVLLCMNGERHFVCAEKAQDAICLAALRACGVEIAN